VSQTEFCRGNNCSQMRSSAAHPCGVSDRPLRASFNRDVPSDDLHSDDWHEMRALANVSRLFSIGGHPQKMVCFRGNDADESTVCATSVVGRQMFGGGIWSPLVGIFLIVGVE
jgi:hypothetical protein